MQPMKTGVRLFFTSNRIDVTEEISPDLLSFEFGDKEDGEADEISITLKDETGKWTSIWKPDAGETVKAFIEQGTVKGVDNSLYCDCFYVDSMRASGGSSRTFEIRGVSVPLKHPIRRKMRSKSWEKETLKAIAQKIAEESKLRFLFDSKTNPTFDRQDQKNESNLGFLSRLCEEAGLSVKIRDNTLIVFDQSYFESQAPITTITLGVSKVISWDFEVQTDESYRSVTIKYRDPKQKDSAKYNMDLEKVKQNSAVMTYTYIDEEADESAQEFEMKKRAKSIEEAKRLAKAKLRQLNKRTVTGSMTLVGNLSLVAGAVVRIKGFGSFDGNFIIEQANHSIGSGGYTTGLSLRRVNTKY